VFVLGYFREASIWIDATRVNPERAGTAQSATSTTIVLDADETAADDEFNNCYIDIEQGTGAGQTRQISDYVASTKTATVPTWTTTPDGTSRYRIYGRELKSLAANNARGVDIPFPSTSEAP
jgi:hypothetical protein